MLELRTDCSKCLHGKVCKNKDNAKFAMKKLKDTNYGSGSNGDYRWDAMSDHLNVKVEFSCPDYEERRPSIGIRLHECTV